MIFSEIKCHVNTSLGLVRGMHPLHPSPCVRACFHQSLLICETLWLTSITSIRWSSVQQYCVQV